MRKNELCFIVILIKSLVQKSVKFPIRIGSHNKKSRIQ